MTLTLSPRSLALASALVCLTMSACGPVPDPTSLITKARIIGSEYSVAGDEARATAAPGETVNVELMVTQKASTRPETSWAIIVCTPAPTAFGVGFCDSESEPLFIAIQPEPVDAPPSFDFEVPANTTGDLLLLGAVCMGGEVDPSLDAEAFQSDPNPCASDAPEDAVGRIITGSIFVAANADDPESTEGNLKPGIEAVHFDGELWEERADIDESASCAGGPLRQLSHANDDEPHVIEVFKTDGSRETYETTDPNGVPITVTEDLPVAYYATERGIGGLYSVIDAEVGDEEFEATPVANIEFDPSAREEEVPDGGIVVRFEIVMSDGRGGMDRATRHACLVP